MDYLALFLAAVGCILVVGNKPVTGLAVYVVLSMWYPYGVGTVSLGTIDFSVGRIVISALFVKVFFNTNLSGIFKMIWLDRFVLILFAGEIIAGLTTIPAMKLIEYRAGDFFDMALPYFAVRLIINDKEKMILLLKVLAWSAAVLSLFGFYESITGNNLLALGRTIQAQDVRLNIFHRAQTTLRHPIYYGIFSAMAGAVCVGLSRNVELHKRKTYIILAFLCFLGCFSAMSSGGLMAMAVSLLFIGFYRYRRKWKNLLVWILIMCVAVEFLSNRHFYDVIDRFCFNSSTAWYRTRLIEVALFEGGMSGHWLFGYGFEDPMWSMKIDYRSHTDMVNHYLLELSRYGLIGFLPFFSVIVLSIKNMFKGFWQITDQRDCWIIWCTAAALFGVLTAFNSVSLFGMPMTLLFMLFGLCGSFTSIIHRKNTNMAFGYIT